MDDWEQPSTSAHGRPGSGGDDIETLRRALAAAYERIESLERRVAELESMAAGKRTQTA